MTSITEYSGRCVDDKYLPAINPAMLAFKPEARPMWEESKNNIIKFISGDLKVVKVTEENAIGIDNVQEIYKKTFQYKHNNKFIIDCLKINVTKIFHFFFPLLCIYSISSFKGSFLAYLEIYLASCF